MTASTKPSIKSIQEGADSRGFNIRRLSRLELFFIRIWRIVLWRRRGMLWRRGWLFRMARRRIRRI
jgi:hypothetical protein